MKTAYELTDKDRNAKQRNRNESIMRRKECVLRWKQFRFVFMTTLYEFQEEKYVKRQRCDRNNIMKWF